MSVIKPTKVDKVFDICNVVFMVLIIILMLYPLCFTLIASVSDPYEVVNGHVYLYPKGFTLEPYQNVFREKRIWLGYRNTFVYTILGTLFNLCLTIPSAYVLSKKNLPGRSVISVYFLIPMYFGGGLIPTYLLVKDIHLINTFWTLVILGGLSVYNMVVTRVFFQTSIPGELYESAHIDGASEFRCFFQIALPLSTSIIAVMALFYAVGHWNDYFTALVYTSDVEIQPLQVVLRGILLLNQTAVTQISSDAGSTNEDIELMKELARRTYMAEGMKYALIFIASAPLLIAYPFVQKYFVKGVMIGSLKG